MVIGTIAALLGVGGSVMTVPLLRRHGYEMQECVSASNPLSLPVALCGAVTYAVIGWHSIPLSGFLGFISLKILGLLVLTGWAGIVFSRRAIPAVPDVWYARIYVLLLCLVLPRHAHSIIKIHPGEPVQQTRRAVPSPCGEGQMSGSKLPAIRMGFAPVVGNLLPGADPHLVVLLDIVKETLLAHGNGPDAQAAGSASPRTSSSARFLPRRTARQSCLSDRYKTAPRVLNPWAVAKRMSLASRV